MLKLFNTLSRKKEDFKSIVEGKTGVYSCGPTVYWYQHIGNLRSYLFSDILKRVLLYNGYKVKHVMNVTDVGHLTSDGDEGDDKMEKAAVKEGRSAGEIAEHYLGVFQDDLEKLNILPANFMPKATGNIKEQIALIKKLEAKNFTYKTDDGIYFNSRKFKEYGRMAGLKVKGLQAGRRVAIGGKKSKTDFALWKFSEKPGERQQEWDSPWGLGFPGWHIECSAMSMKYLGNKFDIHTGGEDHIQVHHTNEIAQSEAATGKKFVNYWLHGAFLIFKGKKVSKSKGGLYTISELEDLGYSPLHFRYLVLQTHYRKKLNFSLENLDASRTAYERLKRRVVELKGALHGGADLTDEYSNKFLKAINDDLNMPEALQIFWKVLEETDFDSRKRLKLLGDFDRVLGLGVSDFTLEEVRVPAEVRKMIDSRERLRKAGKFAEADILRERIKERGFVLEDSDSGVKVRKA